MKDLLELLDDAMKYVMIEDRLLGALRNDVVKMLKCRNWNIANINPILSPIQGKNARMYPITSHYPHEPREH